MAHFAKLDANGIVEQVIVVANEDTADNSGAETEAIGVAFCQKLVGAGTNWKQTSYNTVANTHLLGGTPFRKNYAGIGFTYDASKDAFIPPKPFASWVLDDTTCQWKAPIDAPDDSENSYYWVETLYQSDNTKGWVKVDRS